MADGSQFCMKFDLLHVVPPMGAPDFIAKSSLANKEVRAAVWFLRGRAAGVVRLYDGTYTGSNHEIN